MRGAWRTAWQRHLARLPLEPVQAQMAEVMALHPEYQPQLTEPHGRAAAVNDDDDAVSGAFLHMALHLALREQLATDRPRGIARIYRQLLAADRTGHDAEHRLMEVLGQVLWEAQRAGRAPDELLYLEALRRLPAARS